MKIAAVLFILLVIAILAILYITMSPQIYKPTPKKTTPTSSPTPLSTPSSFTGEFKIITNGLVRNFSALKYHNQSQIVYITSNNPSQVIVKKNGVTWGDFFDTLPMKLTKECLTTGDGETLCSSENSSLKFYLNGAENKNLLDKEIAPGDNIIIEFKSI